MEIMEIMEITVSYSSHFASFAPPTRHLHCLVRRGLVPILRIFLGKLIIHLQMSASWFLSHPKAKLSRKLEFNNK